MRCRLHFRCRGGQFFGLLAGGEGGFRHLADRHVDLRHAARLFARGGGDVGDQSPHLGNVIGDGNKGAAGLVGDLHPRLHAGGGVLDQVRRLARGLGRPARKVAHLLRHHGETAAMLACPRGLYRRIQGQQVGLERDFVDHLDDLRDVLAAGADAFHGRDHLVDLGLATFGHFRRAGHQLTGRRRRRRVRLHLNVGLLRRGRNLIHRRGLDLRVRGQRLRRLAHLFHGDRDLLDLAAHAGESTVQPVKGGVEGLENPPIAAPIGGQVDLCVQLTLHHRGGQTLHLGGDARQTAADRVHGVEQRDEFTLELGIPDGAFKIAFDQRPRHAVHIGDHTAEIVTDRVHADVDEAQLAGEPVQRRIEIAFGKFRHAGDDLLFDLDMAEHHFVHAGHHAGVAGRQVITRCQIIRVARRMGRGHLIDAGGKARRLGFGFDTVRLIGPFGHQADHAARGIAGRGGEKTEVAVAKGQAFADRMLHPQADMGMRRQPRVEGLKRDADEIVQIIGRDVVADGQLMRPEQRVECPVGILDAAIGPGDENGGGQQIIRGKAGHIVPDVVRLGQVGHPISPCSLNLLPASGPIETGWPIRPGGRRTGAVAPALGRQKLP